MPLPATRTALASALSRVPSHSGHVAKVTARSTKARMCGCIDSRSFASIDFLIRSTRPSYVMLMPAIFIRTGSRYRRSCSSRSVNSPTGLPASYSPDSVYSRAFQPPAL